MIIRLQHQRTDGDVDTYHLKSGRRYHIGRGSACEVRILDLKLSRKHCAVEYSEGEWRVIDLASTNGCKVDGDQIVGSVALKVGTQIEIGQTTLTVSRILGDDESGDDEDSSAPGAMPAAKLATPKPGAPPSVVPGSAELRTPPPQERTPLPAQGTPLPAKTNGSTHDSGRQATGRPVEQIQLTAEERSGPVEHIADDWQPEPAPDAATQTGALVPNAAADAAADKALEAARRAANQVAQPGSAGTGEIQKPAALKTPQPGKPSSQELPAVKPEGSSSQYRKTPVPRQPTPLPAVAAEIESGPFKSLDPQPPARAAAMRSEIKPPPTKPESGAPQPTAEAKQPGTETRKRQKIQPVIIQALNADEAATLPTSVPPPAAPPPMSTAAPITSAPPPTAAAPIAAPAPAKTEDDRTFYITVLGRRVGPLTRAVARDLKARELKGTLTLKDLDQFS